MVKGRYQGQGCILAKNKFLLSSGKTHVSFSGQFKHKPGSQLMPKMRLQTFLLLCLVISIYALPRGGGRGGGGRGGGGRGAGISTFSKNHFFKS